MTQHLKQLDAVKEASPPLSNGESAKICCTLAKFAICNRCQGNCFESCLGALFLSFALLRTAFGRFWIILFAAFGLDRSIS